MAKDLYRTVVSTTNYYGTSTTGTECNIRQEMINTLDGKLPEIAKGQYGLLRKMRRTSSGVLIPCACVDPITKEPDKDRFCSFCYGIGVYWDESLLKFYRVPGGPPTKNKGLQERLYAAGLINVPLVVFYIRYSDTITIDDRIVLVDLEEDGTVSSPIKRRAIYRLGDLWDYRADNGKLEYWNAVAFEEKVKYINAPVYADLNNE